MRCLLDKVVARRILLGLLALAQDREILLPDRAALDFFRRWLHSNQQLYIVPATANVISRIGQPAYSPIIEYFQNQTEVVRPARYASRWARRLRDFDFSPEDAAVLALGTFGTDSRGSFLGTHLIATQDERMIHNWIAHQEQIQKRLGAIQKDLPRPYREAELPKVLPPEWIPAA